MCVCVGVRFSMRLKLQHVVRLRRLLARRTPNDEVFARAVCETFETRYPAAALLSSTHFIIIVYTAVFKQGIHHQVKKKFVH